MKALYLAIQIGSSIAFLKGFQDENWEQTGWQGAEKASVDYNKKPDEVFKFLEKNYPSLKQKNFDKFYKTLGEINEEISVLRRERWDAETKLAEEIKAESERLAVEKARVNAENTQLKSNVRLLDSLLPAE